jgi:hypothetical protein
LSSARWLSHSACLTHWARKNWVEYLTLPSACGFSLSKSFLRSCFAVSLFFRALRNFWRSQDAKGSRKQNLDRVSMRMSEQVHT